jgi:hypothetical protein
VESATAEAEASVTGAGSEAAATGSATTGVIRATGVTSAFVFELDVEGARFLGAGVVVATGSATTGAVSRGVIVTVTFSFLATDRLGAEVEVEVEVVIVLEAGIVFILLLRTGYIVKQFQTLNFYFFFTIFSI